MKTLGEHDKQTIRKISTPLDRRQKSFPIPSEWPSLFSGGNVHRGVAHDTLMDGWRLPSRIHTSWRWLGMSDAVWRHLEMPHHDRMLLVDPSLLADSTARWSLSRGKEWAAENAKQHPADTASASTIFWLGSVSTGHSLREDEGRRPEC